MKHSSKKLSQLITQLCISKGIDNIIISPGSRNAPLIIGFSENKNFTCFSIVDERCAAFFALGMAKQHNKPTVLVCSSGSALLNYYPAISEAFYSDIPLVVISADRPPSLIDIGDGQTIKQENVFENHILESCNCIEGDDYINFNQIIISSAINSAITRSGPVHINVPFTEPLYDTSDSLSIKLQSDFKVNRNYTFTENLSSFVKKWNNSKKKLILIGVHFHERLEEPFLDFLAKDESVLILTETTSNLHHKNIINSIDQLITPFDNLDIEKFQPEILLTFGGMVISKKIKALLRKNKPQEHWHIDSKKALNTYFCLSHHFKTTPTVFFKQFLPLTNNLTSNYQSFFIDKRNYRRRKHLAYVDQIVFSDLYVFSKLINSLPTNVNLQLSNSSTIRYVQLFNFREDIAVFCNRGTSGIDGSTSTAIGAAVASEKETVFITGDLSFLYDSNALWNNYIPFNFKIIIINNGGGGIFRILPGEKNTPNFDRFIETKHYLTAEHLCKMFDIKYFVATTKRELEDSLPLFYATQNKPHLLEIFTPSSLNDQILLDYFEYLK